MKKKRQKKAQCFGRERFTLLEMEAITSRTTRNYKEKAKSIFDKKKLKKEASSWGGGEEKSESQSVNNSLVSVRHQRGRNSTDPRPANACTNSCG